MSLERDTNNYYSIIQGNAKVAEILTYDDGSRYFDLPISSDCISKVILGPELSEMELKELKSIDRKIVFSDLITVPSEGTDIITNR